VIDHSHSLYNSINLNSNSYHSDKDQNYLTRTFTFNKFNKNNTYESNQFKSKNDKDDIYLDNQNEKAQNHKKDDIVIHQT
jgi:hypothetical protein